MTAASEQLAQATLTPFAAVPDPVRHRVAFLVADVLAAAVSAWQRPEIHGSRTALLARAAGPASVIGRADGAPPSLAALVNALPVAAEQLQDGHRPARGHPASHVVPAVLAAAEAAESSGPATLSAILTGYEVGVRVGEAMGGTPSGVHDIGTWGPIGAAAGVAQVLSGGRPDAVAAAIELAAALPVRPDARIVFDGADGQHLLLGLAVSSAVVTGTSAAAGLRAPAGTLERYFLPAMGADPRPAELVAGLAGTGWDRYRVLDGYIKRHPTCAHLHGVNDAVEDLVAAGPIDPGSIEQVVVRTYGAAAAFDSPDPEGDLASRFSIPYTVAVGLVSGRLDTGSFSPRWLSDPWVRDLASRVTVIADPALDDGYPSGRPAVVTVIGRDGTVAEARAGRPRGDGTAALDDPGVSSKPLHLLTAAVGAQPAGTVLAAIASLEQTGPARLGRLLRGLFGPAGER